MANRLSRNFKKFNLSLNCMTFFRRHQIQRFLTLATGLVFLNLSFFMTELSLLDLEKHDKQMLKRLVTMLARVSEEEKGSQGSSEPGSFAKEVDLFLNFYISELSAGGTLIKKNIYAHGQSVPLAGMHDTPLQPPEA